MPCSITLPLQKAVSIVSVKRLSWSPYTELFHQFDFRLIRGSSRHAKTVSSSSCGAATIKEAQLCGSTWHSWWSPAWFCIYSHYPPVFRALKALIFTWLPGRGTKIKPSLFPLSTIRPLAIQRDTEIKGWTSFFPTANGGLSLPTTPSEPHQHQRT